MQNKAEIVKCMRWKYNDWNSNFHKEEVIKMGVFISDTLIWHTVVTGDHSRGFTCEFRMI